MTVDKTIQRVSEISARRPYAELNTYVPTSSLSSKRAARYQRSNVFTKELMIVQSELESYSGRAARDIFKFLRWFRPDRSSPHVVTQRIRDCEKASEATLDHYVSFAFRFRVRMHANLTPEGGVKVRPVYEPISDRFLVGRLAKGGLLPLQVAIGKKSKSPKLDPGEHVEDYRARLSDPEAVGYPAVDQYSQRFMRLAVEGESELMRIVEAFYDPLALNFVEIQKWISRAHKQSYLMCLVGELTDVKDWRSAASVRTEMISRLYDVSTRGRRPDRRRFVQAVPHILRNRDNVKATANELENQGGDGKTWRATQERMRRMTSTVAKSTRPFRKRSAKA